MDCRIAPLQSQMTEDLITKSGWLYNVTGKAITQHSIPKLNRGQCALLYVALIAGFMSKLTTGSCNNLEIFNSKGNAEERHHVFQQ